MSRYYQNYDIHGEPHTVLPRRLEGDGSSEAFQRDLDRREAEALAAMDADHAYDKLRQEGKTHAEARAIIKETYGL